MSLSRLSRGTYFLSCAKVSIRQPPILSRYLGSVGSRYGSYIGASNINVYGTPSGFDRRGFVSKHGYNLRICSPERPRSINFGRKISTHAATEMKSKKMFFYLTGLVFAMVGASYAAVPLYRRFCLATGYGGTVQRRESVEEKIARHTKDGTVTSREIVVQFNADMADGMPWKFVPTQREVRVKPGESFVSAASSGVLLANLTTWLCDWASLLPINYLSHTTSIIICLGVWRKSSEILLSLGSHFGFSPLPALF